MDFIGVAVGQYTTPYLVEGGDHEKVRTVHSPPRNCTGTISQPFVDGPPSVAQGGRGVMILNNCHKMRPDSQQLAQLIRVAARSECLEHILSPFCLRVFRVFNFEPAVFGVNAHPALGDHAFEIAFHNFLK
jgi:hypothetical protein